MGLVSFDELLRLADSDDLVGKMKTLTALESMPKIGKVNMAAHGRSGHC